MWKQLKCLSIECLTIKKKHSSIYVENFRGTPDGAIVFSRNEKQEPHLSESPNSK